MRLSELYRSAVTYHVLAIAVLSAVVPVLGTLAALTPRSPVPFILAMIAGVAAIGILVHRTLRHASAVGDLLDTYEDAAHRAGILTPADTEVEVKGAQSCES